MSAVNLGQMGSSGIGDVTSQWERPAWHVQPSQLAGDVFEKAVGSIVPGGDLALFSTETKGGHRMHVELGTT